MDINQKSGKIEGASAVINITDECAQSQYKSVGYSKIKLVQHSKIFMLKAKQVQSANFMHEVRKQAGFL